MTMRHSLWRELVYPVAVLSCIGAGLLAAWEFVLTARYGVYSTLATMIEKGEAVSPAAVTAYAAKADRLPATCRSDLLNAAIAVSMRDVDQMRTIGDQVAWSQALRALQPRLEQGLACVPTDGMLWERLAVVRWFLGGTAHEQAQLLTTSQAYAPRELEVVQVRIVQWKRVTPAVIDIARDALRSDLSVTLLYAPPQAVKAMFADAPPFIAALFKDAAIGMSPERRAALSKADIALP